MKPRRSRKAELAPNAMSGEKSHAETAYPPAGGCPRSGCPSRGESAEFKMTELGPIPEDWEVKKIGDIACVCTGNCNTQDKVDTGKYPFYVRSPIVERINQYGFEAEGVITVGDGVGTGKVFHYVNGKFALHQRCYLIYRFCPMLDGKYLYKIFSARFYDRVMQMTAKSSVDSVRREMITDMLIPLPPLAEQRRIARALSDVDELISALGKLIEKKRNIKTGAMQELLTGKTRLPGFKGKWEEKRLGDVATMFAGGTPPSNVDRYYGGDIPWVSISDISVADKFINETVEQLTEEGLNNSSAKWYPGNTLLFAMYASIGKCCIARRRMTSSQAILGIYNLIDLDIEFLYYLLTLRNDEFLAMGQTGTQSNLSKAIVGNVVVNVPALAEQEAIAAVLSDMDAEIAALEADRAKYERIKSGMMQELLTGKTRLKP